MAAMWCAGTRCFVLPPLNQQLLVTELKTNNSKDHQSASSDFIAEFISKKKPSIWIQEIPLLSFVDQHVNVSDGLGIHTKGYKN